MSTRRVEAQSIVPITGRRFWELRVRLLTGQTISIPVWFVLEGEKLFLLPVQGSDKQWYKNVLPNPQIAQQCRPQPIRAIPTAQNRT